MLAFIENRNKTILVYTSTTKWIDDLGTLILQNFIIARQVYKTLNKKEEIFVISEITFFAIINTFITNIRQSVSIKNGILKHIAIFFI